MPDTAPLPVLSPPAFTGGTGRSGTTVVARMLDRHPRIARTRPWEVRFLTDRFGLCDLVEEREGGPLRRLARAALATAAPPRPLRPVGGPSAFEERLRGPWWRRTAGNGKVVGLHQGLEPEVLERALDGFRDRLREDAPAAARRLVHDLLDPPARALGRERWIETTPLNAARVDSLVRFLPDLRLVHMVRDGRDVCASVAPRYWGPDDMDSALDWWEARMLRAGRALARVPAANVLTVQLEDLVLRDREATLHRVLDFLGLDPAPGVLRFHAEHMAPRAANLGRWEQALQGADRDRFAARYDAALERLRVAGAPVPR
ncbi:sulfotransferase family protein [Vallicoccus soli]|uniref:sulfotransferase family protein n=1 Tax=Vallicoccus soli TaxID=2339232 RepID=UPI001402382B|nr:sulfotransferase [Vallicoccus soli]